MKTSPKYVEELRRQLSHIFQAHYNTVKLARIAIAFGLSSCALFMGCIAAAAQTPFLVVSNPAPSVQLAWNQGSGGTITNNNVYYGVGSGQYTNKTAVGLSTNTTVVLPTRGVTFFFAVTAVDNHGLESPFSNEVNYTPPNPPPAPTMKPLVVLTVQTSPTPNGVFADSGMNWSQSPDLPQTYYKLKIDRGVMLSLATPPSPK